MITLKPTAIFSTPLLLTTLGSDAADLNRALLRDAYIEKERGPKAKRSGVDAWQSKLGMERKYASFEKLRSAIEQIAHSYLPMIGYSEALLSNIGCRNLWFNLIEDGQGFHIPHIHGKGDELFSGAYYPTGGYDESLKEVDPSDWSVSELRLGKVHPGDLILIDPAHSAKRQVVPKGVTGFYYGTHIKIQPKQSTLVIFPNYLMHMVAPISGKRRMSISFAIYKKNMAGDRPPEALQPEADADAMD